jgi:nucleotide-binding universal stress UspA family protein
MQDREERTDRHIVVGVDGSLHSEAALRWALGQARLTGARIEALCAWQYPVAFGFTHAYVPDQGGLLPELSQETLDKTIAAVTDENEPQVDLVRVVVQGHAAEMLLQAAQDADLLVLGSHGHGPLAGILLGSVTQHCVHHSRCPVVVIPAVSRPAE